LLLAKKKVDAGQSSTSMLKSAVRKNKSFGPDGIPGEILELGGEAMIPYLARLLDIMMNSSAIPEALCISYEMWQEQIISVLNVNDRQNIYSMDHTATLC
jgi:hypothetical protein